MNRYAPFVSVFCLCMLAAGWSAAQAQEVEPAHADGPGVGCAIGAPAGARRYRVGRWSVVGFRGYNLTDESAEVQAALRFVDTPATEYSRRAVLPPHSVLRSTCPVRVPETLLPGQSITEMVTRQILPAGETGVGPVSPSESRLRSPSMILDREDLAVGMIADLGDHRPPVHRHPYHVAAPPVGPEPDRRIQEMVLAAKRARKLSRRVSTFGSQWLPADPLALDVLDVLVLSSDGLAEDPAAIASVRDWVLSGGHLWITLDDVAPKTVTAVLGDAFACEVLDTVDLTAVSIVHPRAAAGDSPERVEYEEPVKLARVIPRGVTTMYRVNGWPAAFWQTFGAGKVFFTAVGADAWIRPTKPSDPPPRTPQDATAFFPRKQLESFADACLSSSPTPLFATENGPETLKAFLSRQIGYRILGRGAVMSVLSGFCVAIVLAGVWLYRRDRPDRIAWFMPGIAALAGLFFLVYGVTTKRAVPPTAATVSHVVMERGVGTGHASGLAAVYNQTTADQTLASGQGGVVFPDMQGLSDHRRRLVWTDAGDWRWEGLQLPPGVRTAPLAQPVRFPAAVEANARFGPDGIVGNFGPLPAADYEDAVIACPRSRFMAAAVDAKGRFRSGPEDVLEEGEYMSGALVSDAQMRRRQIYAALFENAAADNETPRPQIYVWTTKLEPGVEFSQAEQRHSTLLSFPCRLERTAAGTDVTVPAPWIPYRAIPGPDGDPPVVFTNFKSEWVETRLGVTEWFRFQLPETVLPLEVTGATVSLSVRAPSRTVELLAPDDGELVPLVSWRQPIGTYLHELDDAESIAVDDEGGIRLVVRVSDEEMAETEDQMKQATWKIERFQLAIRGRVAGEQ